MPRRLAGDAGRICQILLNLAGNAVKFTRRGQVIIEVDCVERSQHDARLRISVLDTGPGISEADRSKLFQRFSRLDSSSTRTEGGTGLGLAISRGLAELMGGRLDVESTLGEGSTFSLELTLPFARMEEPRFPGNGHPSRLTRRESCHRRVLVVEDNLVNQRVATLMLEKLGCRVDVARDGRKAVEIFATSSYDLVLMDCLMPDLDGYEATAAIRELEDPHGRRTPIVAMTANAMSGDREKCLAAGMNDYITKPIHQSELVRILEQWSPAAVAWASAR